MSIQSIWLTQVGVATDLRWNCTSEFPTKEDRFSYKIKIEKQLRDTIWKKAGILISCSNAPSVERDER